MRSLTLSEYATASDIRLSTDTRDALQALVPSLSITPAPGRSNHYNLTPGSSVGSVQVGDLAVVISPKLPISRVLFMLSYGLDPKAWRNSPFNYGEARSLVEAVIPGFLYHLRSALGPGVLQGYRVEEDTLQTVRGAIRFADQVRRQFGRCVPAEVRFDEFTIDITENQLLKAALTRLGRLRIRSEENRTGLRRYEAALDLVSNVEFAPRNLPAIIYTRLNDRYRPAIELAKLIIRSSSLEMRHGQMSGQAVLFDMNKVFEDFVVNALRETLRVSAREFVQGGSGKGLYLDR